MAEIALILFAITAVGGLIMAAKIFQGSSAPWLLSIGHALLGVGGLILLLIPVVNGSSDTLLPLIILVVAALGGFFLAFLHLKNKPAPRPVVVIHALVAVFGVLALANLLYL